MRELLGRDGYRLKELWSENRWALDVHGNKTATAFVLQDTKGRELDVHAMHFDDQGNGVPEWEDSKGLIFKKQDLACVGMITGHIIQCITPESQMFCHMEYELPEKHFRDLELLHEKFDVAFPKGLRVNSTK
jgi:hypothetical protein